MGNDSRYSQFSFRKVRHQKRTIRVQGAKEDDGKFYRCWNCGFINDIDRNAVGTGTGVTNSIQDEGNLDPFGAYGPRAAYMSLNGGITLTASEQVKYNFVPDIVSGCSFCGSMNYR